MRKQRLLLFFLAVLSLIGIALSWMTLDVHVRVLLDPEYQPKFCHFSDTVSCLPVIGSPYSMFAGLPLGSYGMFFYILFLLTAAIAAIRNNFPRDVFLLAGLAACIVSVVLFLISEFIIGALCPICFAMYGVNIGLFVMAYFLAREQSFFRRLLNAAVVLLRAPLSLVGKALVPWIVLMGILVLMAFSVILPAILITKVAAEMDQRLRSPHAVDSAIKEWQAQTPIEIPALQESGLLRDYRKGSSQASINILEFSDMECPACRRLYIALEQLMEDYPGKISLTLRSFPLDQACNKDLGRPMHKNACYAATFARCAGEQEKFWEAVDFIFRLPAIDLGGDNAQIRQTIQAGIDSLSLDGQAMTSCLDSGRHNAKLVADIELGKNLGLQATPTLWINGRKYEGANEAVLRGIIEELLGKRTRMNVHVGAGG